MDEEIKKKVVEHYQKGQGSIQDIARIYKVDVEQVLMATGNNDLVSVTFVGDLIDDEYLNGTNEKANREGFKYKQKYTTD